MNPDDILFYLTTGAATPILMVYALYLMIKWRKHDE